MSIVELSEDTVFGTLREAIAHAEKLGWTVYKTPNHVGRNQPSDGVYIALYAGWHPRVLIESTQALSTLSWHRLLPQEGTLR